MTTRPIHASNGDEEPRDLRLSESRRERRKRRDAELMARMARRDREAFAELYDRYASTLLAVLSRMLGNREDAEEVLQEAFTQSWRLAPRYDPERSSVSTWLTMLARSRALDRLRSHKTRQRTVQASERVESAGEAPPAGATRVLDRERRRRIRQVLSQIPAVQRQVIELRFYEGLTQSEIAERVGIPLGTVKTRTFLAMKKLRQGLQSEIAELV